ncbi:DUF4240 domain-containing protein [Kitasatospora aureofaciens]|uniref:DUF4240 domain-containing protein n=1 Tax=Kitasatospora aureofaciens TaxID=1894 RepID=UPI0037C5EDE4
MDIDGFWNVIEAARAESRSPHGEAFAEALVNQLAGLSQEEILAYQERFDEVHGAVYRWDVWAAAYLIGGGCSDDSFVDFRAGLIALGGGLVRAGSRSAGRSGGPLRSDRSRRPGRRLRDLRRGRELRGQPRVRTTHG